MILVKTGILYDFVYNNKVDGKGLNHSKAVKVVGEHFTV